jgi:hypothetical protein
MATKLNEPFADWLSISFAPTHSPYLALDSFFSQLGVIEHKEDLNINLYRFLGGGTCFLSLKKGYHNFMFSGSLISVIQELGFMNEFVSLLSENPHNITRLDVAYDFALPFPLYYEKLKKLYPKGLVNVRGHERKSLAILGYCSRSKALSGTYYFQAKDYKGSIGIRVYDKSKEVFDRTGEVIPITTRIEITLKRGASLIDFVSPSAAFWHHLPPCLLKVPENVPPFVLTPRIGLSERLESDLTVFQEYDILFERSAYLQSLKAQLVGKPIADKRAMRISLLNALSLYDID